MVASSGHCCGRETTFGVNSRSRRSRRSGRASSVRPRLLANFAGMIGFSVARAASTESTRRFQLAVLSLGPIRRRCCCVREFTEFAVHLADLASEQILPRFRVAIGMENKSKDGGYDPVTVADREAEAAIRREIRRVYPDHGILGEEHGLHAGTSSYTWVIDPIDGTRAFVLGQLHWGTLIALHDGKAPIVGIMRQPYTGETFLGSAAGAELRRGSETTRLAARANTR